MHREILSDLTRFEVGKGLTHSVVVLRGLFNMTVYWATSLRVTQHTGVVHEWCRSLIRLSVELNEHPLNIE